MFCRAGAVENMTIHSDSHAQLRVGRSRAALVGSIWSSINTFIPAIVSAIVFFACSKVLAPSEFGIVAYAASLVSIGMALAPIGLEDAIIQRKEIDRAHLDSVFTLLMIIGLLFYAIVLIMTPLISSWRDDERIAQIMPVLGLVILFKMLMIVPNSLLTRKMNFRIMALRTTIASLLAGATCLTILYLGYGLWALVAAQLTSVAANAIGAVLSVRWIPRLKFNIEALRQLLRYGLYSSGARIISTFQSNELLIGTFLGNYALGIYNFAKRVFSIIDNTISGALNSVSFSLLSSLQDEPEKRRDAFMLATFLSAGLSFPVFLGLLAVSQPLVDFIFGDKWTPAVPVLCSFCVFGLLGCIGILQASLIKGAGYPEKWFTYMLVKKILTFAVIGITLQFGIVVVAWSIALLSLLTWPFAVKMTLNILKVSSLTYLKSFFGPLLAGTLMVLAVTYLDTKLVNFGAFYSLCLQILAGGFVYFSLLLILSYNQIQSTSRIALKAFKS